MKIKILYIILLFSMMCSNIMAQITDSWWNTDYQTTEGTEFWVTFMRNSGAGINDSGKKLSCYLYIATRENATVEITNPNGSFNTIVQVKENTQEAVQIPLEEAYIEQDFIPQNCGIHVKSDKPISVYSTNHHQSGKYDGTNVLPITPLMSSYVVQTYIYDESAAEFAIIASEDQEVTLKVQQTNLDELSFNNGILDTISIDRFDTIVNLLRGQTFLYRTKNTIYSSLSGTNICSDIPFTLIQGGQNVKIPQEPENHIFHQATSLDLWGKEFVATSTYRATYDYIRITAAEDNTIIMRDGVIKATIHALETYQDTIETPYKKNSDYKPTAVVYKTSKPTTCFLYATGKDVNGYYDDEGEFIVPSSRLGSPALTPIAPQEYGINSVIFATLSDLSQEMTHYVNIVTHTSEIGGMKLDNNPIASYFNLVPNNSNYSYAIIEIEKGAHKIENSYKNINSTFTARVYGLGKSAKSVESYAYSVGSRITHSADLLINDEYKSEEDICIGESVKFTPIINYDFSNYYWWFKGPGSDFKTPSSTIEKDHRQRFDSVGDWEVNLVIERVTPLCNTTYIDTIKAVIHVHDTAHYVWGYNDSHDQDICYGDSFYVHYNDGKRYDYIADTTTTQEIHGKLQTFKLDSQYVFRDTLATTYGCDSIISQIVYIRPPYETIVRDTICVNKLPYHWKDKNGNLIRKLNLSPQDTSKLIIREEHVFQSDSIRDEEMFISQYGCDSLVKIQLTILPVYDLHQFDTVCVDSIYNYTWQGHYKWSGNQKYVYAVPINKSGEYEYVDSLQTIVCKQCDLTNRCDSVWTLHLKVRDKHIIQTRSWMCSDDYYEWQDTLWLGWDCPLSSIPTGKVYQYVYKDTTLRVEYITEDSTYCDGEKKHELHICPTYLTVKDTVYKYICEGEPYYFESKDTTHIWNTPDGVISRFVLTDTIPTEKPCYGNLHCDRAIAHVIYVHPKYEKTHIDSICQGYPYSWGHHQNRNLYDSIQQKEISISSTVPTNEPGWHIYIDSLQTISCSDCNAGGCDSIWTLRLYVKPLALDTQNISICPEQLPYPYGSNGKVAYLSGIYSDTIIRNIGDGCDSITTYIINVSDENRDTISVTICQNEVPYSFDYSTTPTTHMHFTNLTQSGLYLDTIRQSGICDRIIALDLTINDTSRVDTTYYLCVGDTYIDQDFSDITATSNIDFIKRLEKANSKGCDSVVHVTVKFGPTYIMPTAEIELCESDSMYVWTTTDADGNHVQTLRWGNLHETVLDTTLYQTLRTNPPFTCDSVVSIHVIVKPTVIYEHDVNICPTQVPYFDFGNRNDSAWVSGTYTHYITGGSVRYGCDSIEILHLTISDSIITHIDTTVCRNELPYYHASYHSTPNLDNLTDSGTYRQILTAASGCDSTIVLHLSINDTSRLDTTYYLCVGDTYIDQDFSDITATSNIDFIKRLEKANSKGCDSVVHVTVKFGPTYNVQDSTMILCEADESYTWKTEDSYGEYFNTLIWGDLQEQVLDTILFDTLHTANPFYCDSITSIRITINPTTINEYSILWCASAGPYSYGEKGKTASATGTYIDTLITKNHHGCDSVEIVHLEWRDSIYQYDTIRICDNTIFAKHNKLYIGDKFASFGGTYDANMYDSTRIYSAGTYHDTITFLTSNGCDSTFYICVDVQNTHFSIQERDVCQFADVTYEAMHNGLGGTVITDVLGDLQFVDTIPALGNGCDSIVHMTYHIRPHYHFSQGDIVLCQAKDSMWVWYNEEGHPQDTISLSKGDTTYILGTIYETVYGCDSTYGISIYIAPSYHIYDTLTLCESDSLHWQGMLFVGSQYTQYGKTYDASIFDSTKVALKADTYDYAIRRGTNIYDCDSIHHLHLMVNPVERVSIEIRQCQTNEPYYYKNMNRGVGGYLSAKFLSDSLTRIDTLSTINYGCDSIITLHFYVDSVYRYGIEYTFCQDTIDTMREWIDEEGISHGFVLDVSKAGSFTKSVNNPTIHGCDSTYGVTWHVNPSYGFDSIYTICQNERIDWQGRGYTGSKYGRKSEYISKQIINDRGDTIAIHSDSIYYEYEIGDRILEAGTYYDTAQYTTHLGCDSTYCLKLIVLPSYDTIIDTTICDNAKSFSITYGTYQETISIDPINKWISTQEKDTAFYTREFTIPTINGCDSTMRLHLTVYPTYEYTDHVKICEFEEYEWHGKVYTRTGIYYDSLQTKYGCDSVHILDLFVKPVVIIPVDTNICDNQVLYHSDTLWYGVDSLVFDTVNTLLWKPGMEIPKPNQKRLVRYRAHDGCDSLVYEYSIHVHPTFHKIDTLALCSNTSFNLHDSLTILLDKEYDVHYTVAPRDTVFIDSLLSVHGCDSIFEVHATIYPAYRYVTDTSVCENKSIIWRGIEFKKGDGENMFTGPGDYVYYQTDTTQAYGHACDSIYELRLHVDPIQSRVIDTTICADCPYLFADTLLNETGVYYDTIQTLAGCDSVLTLNLTVLDTTNIILFDTICVTEKCQWHGRILTESGDYDTITINEWGCKDYHYLHLNVIDTTSYSLEIGDVLCADDEEIWVYYQYTGRMLIEYSVLFDAMGHAQGFQDIHHAPLDLNSNYFSIPIPKGEVLPHPTPTYFDSQQGVNQYTYEDKYAYPLPQKYHMTIIMHNGICGDTLQRKDTIFDLLYPSWIHEQHWNDGIVLYNEQYNGGHIFTSYQWLQNGKEIIGATKEYFYIPSELWMNNRGECNNYYQVELTRLSDGYKTITCPICPVVLEDTIVPREDYYAIVPTTVVKENPVVHILSTRPGTYVVYNLLGYMILNEPTAFVPNEPTAFVPNEKNYASTITLPAVNGYYIVSMEMNNGDKRCVIVRVE